MDAMLEAAGARVDWGGALVCDMGGGGGLRAAMLAGRARRAYCADVIDQQARYGGEFAKLLAEKLARHGMSLPVDRFEFHVADAMQLIYRDNLFDFVCSVNAFEHIPDPAAAFRELVRVLRPGGHAFVSFDPIWTADTGSHFAHYVPEPWGHLVMDESEFQRRMREAGAQDWEVREFAGAMNRVRLARYRQILDGAADAGAKVLFRNSWQGVSEPSHEAHPNLERALKSFSREELMTRGIAFVLRKIAA